MLAAGEQSGSCCSKFIVNGAPCASCVAENCPPPPFTAGVIVNASSTTPLVGRRSLSMSAAVGV